MTQTAADTLASLIADILRLPKGEIDDSIDMESTGAWDSLSHMQIIAAVEDEYHVELSSDDIIAMRSVGQIKGVLRAHGVAI